MSPINIEITTRGEVSRHAREQAREKIGELEAFAKGPFVGARVVLTHEPNPRIPMHARAEAELDLQGRPVRARTAAPSMEAAVDDLAERLQRQLRRYIDHLVTSEREPATPTPGEWSHHAWWPPRPPTFVRPPEEREIIRRKSFALGPMSVEKAVEALEDLDHQFFLFHHAATDADAVVYWRDDGLLGLIQRSSAEPADARGVIRERSRYSSPIAVETATAEMDAVEHRFLFFENVATGRGNVIYRRYDGHYGLIEPGIADEDADATRAAFALVAQSGTSA